MLKTEHKVVLTGTLDELLVSSSHRADIVSALAGERKKTRSFEEFRIPAADNGNEVWFYNRELFARFASLALPTQKDFLQAIRETMEREGVDTMQITAPWSSNKTRTIKIVSSGEKHEYLDFRL